MKRQTEINGKTPQRKDNVPPLSAAPLLFDSDTLLAFCIRSFRRSRTFCFWRKCIRYARRFRLITTVFRLIPWILLLFSTNTLRYALAAMLVLFLPLPLLALFSFLSSAFLRYKKVNKYMKMQVADKTVFVFFPPKRQAFSGGFWLASLRELANDRNGCVIVVSPYWISARGPCGRQFYFNLRKEQNNLFLIRRHYFFSLRKHVLHPHTKRLIFIN